MPTTTAVPILAMLATARAGLSGEMSTTPSQVTGGSGRLPLSSVWNLHQKVSFPGTWFEGAADVNVQYDPEVLLTMPKSAGLTVADHSFILKLNRDFAGAKTALNLKLDPSAFNLAAVDTLTVDLAGDVLPNRSRDMIYYYYTSMYCY